VSKSRIFPFSRRTFVPALLVVLVVSAGCGGDDAENGKDAKADKEGSTSTTFTFSGASSEAFCARYLEFINTYSTASLDPAAVPVEEVARRWAAAIAALEAMEADANAEIAPDVTLLRERIQALLPALAAVGYDPMKVPEADREQLQDEASQQASSRLTAYSTQVCEPRSGK
jgi:hypothetical protein